MGTWSKQIICGDESWDTESDIYKWCGVKQYDKNDKKKLLTAAKLEKNQLVIMEHLKKEGFVRAFQVFGVLMMNAGARFLPEVSSVILECLREDGWALESLERKYYVDSMIKVMEKYITLETPVPTDEEEDIPGVTVEDWQQPRTSPTLVRFVADYFKEYCKKYPVILDVKFGFRKYHGYTLLCLINDDAGQEAFNELWKDESFAWEGMFEIPVMFISTDDLSVTVKK